MRKNSAPKRNILPVPVYNSRLVTKAINTIMLDGKKGIAQNILWNTMVDVNDENFESKKSEVDENNFISETVDIIYESLVSEITNIESHEEENLCDEEEAITKDMACLINEIKGSIEKEEDANNNTHEEFEY